MKTNYILALIALIGGLFAAFTSYSEKNNFYPSWKFESERMEGGKVDYISSTHLADLLYRKDRGIVLLDLRNGEEYEACHIHSALRYEQSDRDPDREKGTFVVYGLDSGIEAREFSANLPGKVYVLKGGIEAWQSLVLFPDFIQYKVRNKDALEYVIRRSRYFGGSPVNSQVLNIDLRQSRYREGC